MTPQQPRELFVSERPMRSDYSVERSYARRRAATIGVLGFVLVGVIFGLWGHHAPNPTDIPTIHAEGSIKQKPANPGGIDIPHQDVRIYDELEGKNTAVAQVEHLLPPPEIPHDVPHGANAEPAPIAAMTTEQSEAVKETLTAAKSDIVLNDVAPQPSSSAGLAPLIADSTPDAIAPEPKAAIIATTAKQSALSKKILVEPPPKQVTDGIPENLTIEQIIKDTTPKDVTSKSASQPVLMAPSTASAINAVSPSSGSAPVPEFASVLASQTPSLASSSTSSPSSATPPQAPATAAPMSLTAAPAPMAIPITAPKAAPSPPPVTTHAASANLTSSSGSSNSGASSSASGSGNTVIQLASSTDQGKAESMMKGLKQKYGPQLGRASLRLVSANVSGRGTFYRIQSQSLSEDEANQICSSLKSMSAGCILVRK